MTPSPDPSASLLASTGWPDADGEKLLDALAEFAAGAAHEFNNPLTVISGRAQLMAERTTGEDREVWQTIAQQATRMSTAIDRLMTFSSPPPASPKSVQLVPLLDEIISETFSKIPPNAQPPNCDKTIEAVPAVWVDASQLREALSELLANAVEACEPPRDIRLTVRMLEDSAVRLTLCDGGAGMSQTQLARALLPFASGQCTGGYEGLGMARAWRLIANNGGRMQIRSAASHGTIVDITLLLAT